MMHKRPPTRYNRFVSPQAVPDILVQHAPIGGIECEYIHARNDLSLRDKRILMACLMVRDLYQRETFQMKKAKDLAMQGISQRMQASHSIVMKKLTGPLRTVINILLGRNTDNSMTSTSVDFAVNELTSDARQKIDLQQSPRRREVTDFACHKEDHYRALLARYGSPEAKEIFNQIKVSGRSLSLFKPHEIQPRPTRHPAPAI